MVQNLFFLASRAGGCRRERDCMLPDQVAQFTELKSCCSVTSCHIKSRHSVTSSWGHPCQTCWGGESGGWLGGGKPDLASGVLRTCIDCPRSTSRRKPVPLGLRQSRSENSRRLRQNTKRRQGLGLLLLQRNALSQSFVEMGQFIPIGQLGTLGGARSGREMCLI